MMKCSLRIYFILIEMNKIARTNFINHDDENTNLHLIAL